MFSWDGVDTWVVVALFVLALLTFAQNPDVGFASQPLFVAAASLITVPIAIAGALMGTWWGVLLLPIFFILFVYYIATVYRWVGSGAFYFILAAAAVVVLTSIA
jgi:hypothetical protein